MKPLRFGLVGAGRSELLKLIFGAARATAGTIRVHGRPVTIDSPGDAIRAGLMLCPEDRKKEGIVPIRSVMENINISARRNTARMGFFVNEHWERENAQTKVKQLGIKTPTLHQLLRNLSGGNQQKVILARWLSEQIKVILLDEDGNLGLVKMSSERLKILARAPVAAATSWTVPTLIGTTLYIRDRVRIVALAVGAQ